MLDYIIGITAKISFFFVFKENYEKDEDSLSLRRNTSILPIEEEGKHLEPSYFVLYILLQRNDFYKCD